MSERTAFILTTFLRWLDLPGKRQQMFIREFAVFFTAVVLILFIDFNSFSPEVIEGHEAPKTIVAPRAISFVDERKTAELRRLEEERVEPVITHIDDAEAEMLSRFSRFMGSLGRFTQDWRDREPSDLQQDVIASYFPSDRLLDEEDLRTSLGLSSAEIDRVNVTGRQMLLNYNQTVISARTLDSVRADVKKNTDTMPGQAAFKKVLTDIVRNALMVNSIEDEKATRARRESASRSVTPVKRNFQKGQKIVDRGVIVSADDVYVLKTLEKQLQKNRALALVGNFLLAALLTLICLTHLRLTRHQILKESELFRLTAGLWIATLFLAKIVIAVGSAYDQWEICLLLSPLPAIGLLMVLLLDFQLALFHQLLLGILLFVLTEANARLAIVSLLGGILGTLVLHSSKEGNLRGMIGWAGLKAGVANAIALLGLLMLDGESMTVSNLRNIGIMVSCAFGNGIVAGIVANGVLPYVESFFALATGSRLLELADLSQPLMKRLAEEAPGTYQHSMMVANLSEAAANEINADGLLAKIGAYFHDIGKLKRPLYFVENQTTTNQHDQLTPYMSSLILVGHIRDGADLAREYALPERVVSLITQHHGTTLISYFYEQAKTDTEGQAVSEERFRYPGPKPQTKEAAIIMLADAVEAASRTLPQHTHSRIEGLVKKIVENKLNDENQLDESDLTLKDIERIEQTFVRVLTSMYHGRIDYPGKLSNQPKGGSDGNPHQQPAKEE
ncbi:MAG: hypothetical protein BWY66_02338 [bacterium ADurb.Bin374]|nr:MAG: hypothetical protein BWY66_02338 [bacterium ADurb.Bin374]